MKQKKRLFILAGIIVVVLSASFTTIRNKDLELVKNLDIYYTLFRELNMFYVDETDPKELVTTSINAMLSSLDPYTTFIPESDMDDFKFQTTGEYGGIGALIRRSGNYTIIADPYPEFPADKVGMRAGDKILKVDGIDVEQLPVSSVSEKLKGAPGTELKLTVERYGEEKPLNFKLIREKITIQNVRYSGMLNESIGYIRLSNFTTGAGQEVENALRKLKSEHDVQALVLDLRGNPGGLLLEAVRVSNLFVEKGELIVSTRGKLKQWMSDYRTTSDPVDKEIPLVVMVNRASASASEIVAGALQDLDRAVIVGERTFGKGLVQTSRPLKYNAQLKVTTAKYYIPSGRCIQALDYTHRNEDGSVGKIPDSLITEYQTRNKRLVYDGGGIQPDFQVEAEDFSEILLQLYAQNVLFDYATRYRSENEMIGDPKTFSITDDQYESFKSYVEERNFEFKTSSEKVFENLIKAAKREKYYELAVEEFSELEEKLAHNNLKDLETFQDEIRQVLNEEIVGRYHYQAGRIVAQIVDDVQLDKAIEILNEPGTAKEVLEGKIGALASAREIRVAVD
jgi:carboxyl-terminal processing protease